MPYSIARLFQPLLRAPKHTRGLFCVSLNYVKPLEEVEPHLSAHRSYLEEQYAKGYFIASGPKVPRTGGVILASVESKDKLDAVLSEDPFRVHGVAEYEISEFMPTMRMFEFEDIADKDLATAGYPRR